MSGRHAIGILGLVSGLALLFGLCAGAKADEGLKDQYLSIGASLRDDGGCSKIAQRATARFVRESARLDVLADVSSAPSGGDCRQTSTSFGVQIKSFWPAWGDWDVQGEFAAAENAVGATYALEDSSGAVLLRPDGMALFATTLPAGSAKTVVGAVGVSREFEFPALVAAGADSDWTMRIGAGVNVAPIDWADGTSSRTGRFTLGLDAGRFDLDVSFDSDVGDNYFGSANARYVFGLGERVDLEAWAGLDWGLNSLDGGEPAVQEIEGAMFRLAGAPQGVAWGGGVSVVFRPDK